MRYYSALRQALFQFPPELTHKLSLKSLQVAYKAGLLKPIVDDLPQYHKDIMGLHFSNPIGIAAGLDKDGECFNALGAFGFGFVEVGTVTPKPQKGNPGKRIFRLPAANAVINRLGFNSAGIEVVEHNLKNRQYQGILGVNIGKNMSTPIENALQDYLTCMVTVYPYADYITINISSPNTQGLRDLQYGNNLSSLLQGIAKQRQELFDNTGKLVPIAIKLSPDNTKQELKMIVDVVVNHKMDAIIATNTTISRDGIEHLPYSRQQGGLSGAPLHEKSTECIATIRSTVDANFPIIGVGGIVSGQDAKEKIAAGADLIQFYTGLIYRGPTLLKECLSAIYHSS